MAKTFLQEVSEEKQKPLGAKSMIFGIFFKKNFFWLERQIPTAWGIKKFEVCKITHEWFERSGSSSGILSAAPRKVAPFSSQKYSSFPHPNYFNQKLEVQIKLKIFSFSN